MTYGWYYLATLLLTFALERPWFLAGIVVFFLLRRFLPEPVVLFRTWGKIQSLSMQIEANPANITTRRDLAKVWLDRLRPRLAVHWNYWKKRGSVFPRTQNSCI